MSDPLPKDEAAKQTPLTVEALLQALEKSFTAAGFNGSCHRVVEYDRLTKELRKLVQQ